MSNPSSHALPLRLATRGSPLALAQAHLARQALASAHGWHPSDLDRLCPILTFRTSGDRIQDRPLAEAGGKGLFVKEIEEALLSGAADIAVHSMKDVPAVLPEGLVLAAILPREDPRDVFLARDGQPFARLKLRARLGTSSVRRAAQALRRRPDLDIVPLRGNVETRLAKLERGDADGILLARAGIVRLHLALERGELLDPNLWLPALCQGAVGIEIRADDDGTRALVAAIDDRDTHFALACERGFLERLDGSCRTPIAGLARRAGARLLFTGEVLTPDGKKVWTVSREIAYPSCIGDEAKAAAALLGREAASEILSAAGPFLPRT